MTTAIVTGGPQAINGTGGVVIFRHVEGDTVYVGSTGQVSPLAYEQAVTAGQLLVIGGATKWLVTERGGRAKLHGVGGSAPSNPVRVVGNPAAGDGPTFDQSSQVYVSGEIEGGAIGSIVAPQDFLYDGAQQVIFEGQEIFRYDSIGNPVWGRNLLGQDANVLARDQLTDAAFDQRSGRWIAKSFQANCFEDPPDLTFARSGATNYEKSGSDGVTGTPNPDSFSAATAGFVPGDDGSRGRGIVLDGVKYLIGEVLSTTTATLLDLNFQPAVLAADTGVVWQIPRNPYPESLTGAAGAVGQVRVTPFAAQLIRSGSNAVTNSTTTLELPGGVTTADVNRWVQLAGNDDYTYQIVGYVDATHVTLDRAHPVTASGVAFRIAGNLYDGGAIRTPLNPATLGFIAESPPVCFGENLNYAPTNAYLTLQGKENLVDGGAPAYTQVFRYDGSTDMARLRLCALGEMSAADATPPTDAEVWRSSEGVIETNARLLLNELSDPAAPAANKAAVYVRDNGSGKTQLVVRFPTGAVQVVATEP